MKKIYGLLLGCLLAMGLTSCADKFEEKYQDPSKTPELTCDKIMTGVIYKGNTWMNPVYYRYYVQNTTSGRFSQVIGTVNSRGRYQGAGVGYFNVRWQNFYDMLTQYRVLQNTFNKLADNDKPYNRAYVVISRTVMQEQLDEMLTLFGDLPYTHAGYLWNAQADISGTKAAYDKSTDIYKTILSDLKETNTFLKDSTAYVQSTFGLQDYVNKGDMKKWRKFANSLRLRIAIRLSSQGDLVNEAQAVVKEMLSDPETYPMVDSNDDNTTVAQDDDAFNFDQDMQNALGTSSGNWNRASGAVLKALNVSSDGTYANADPRLPILYDSNWDDKYFGLDPSQSLSEQETNMNIASHGKAKYYAAVDTATFSRNAKLPGVWMTAAEVSFSKAEAYAMGWAGSVDAAKAKEYFLQGMKQSTDFYYDINSTATYRTPTPEPADNVIEQYAERQWDASNMQKCIITQKWLNFFIVNQLEAWNCVRRTGYPVLQFADDTMGGYEKVPSRLKYATDELNYNTANYNAATNNGATDTWTNPLFWMKSNWYTTIQ